MAIRIDTYYENNKDLSVEEIDTKISELEAWLNSDERREFEESPKNKPITQVIDSDNPIQDKETELEILNKIKSEKQK